MQSRGISTSHTGLKAWKRHLHSLSCAGLHGILSSGGILQEGEDETQGQGKAKQGAAPLPGTQLVL